MTMVGAPKLIFLDKPTTGLDLRSRRTLWQTVKYLVERDGVTVFLTTQYLEEADRLADRVAILSQGAPVAEGSPEELKRVIPGGHVTVRFADEQGHRTALAHIGVTARDDAALTAQIPNADGIKALAVRIRAGGLLHALQPSSGVASVSTRSTIA